MCLFVCHQILGCEALRCVYDAIIRCTKSYDNDLEEPAKLSFDVKMFNVICYKSNGSFYHYFIFGSKRVKPLLICLSFRFIFCLYHAWSFDFASFLFLGSHGQK